MAFASRSSIFAFVPEVTEGTPVDPAADNFTVVREGATMSGAVETVTSDELRSSIGAAKSYATKQVPTASIPKYFTPSGVEGQAPDYGILIKACLGGEQENGTEYSTVSGSTAGSASARATIKVTNGQEVNFAKGEALLIKDGVNGYAVRNIWDGITTGTLPLAFNLAVAPATGVGLGKAVFYYPADPQPTFTAHMFQSSSAASAVHQAMAGCRTTAMQMEFTANQLASISFEIGGNSFFINPITITDSSKYIDFVDDGGTKAVALTVKTYQSPMALAREIASKMSGTSVDVISCAWDNSTGKFTISSDGTTFSLLWNSGTNTANSAKTKLGFANTDDTSATTYTSDNAQTYAPAVTPVNDDIEPQVVRHNMFQFGTFNDYICAEGSTLSISVATPKTDVDDFCSETGVDESVITSREVTFSATAKFNKHDVAKVDAVLNNENVQVAFTHGARDGGGNWIPGKIINVFMAQCSLTGALIADQDGYLVYNVEGTAFVEDLEDIYINTL